MDRRRRRRRRISCVRTCRLVTTEENALWYWTHVDSGIKDTLFQITGYSCSLQR
jgi:hypothetical protein